MMTLRDGLNHLLPDSNNRKTLVIAGDSFSWGSGIKEYTEKMYEWPPTLYKVEQYDLWPKNIKFSYGGVIAKTLGFDCINISIPGGSNDTISRTIINFANQYPVLLNNSYIIIGWTATHRFEIPDKRIKSGFRNMSPLWETRQDAPEWMRKYKRIYADYIYSEEVAEFNSYKNMIGTLSYLKLINANFMSYYSLNTFTNINIEEKMSVIKEMKNFEIAGYCNKYPDMLFPCLHPNEKLHSMLALELLNISIY